MKTAIITAFLFSALNAAGIAQLGETFETCQKRYGAPTKTEHDWSVMHFRQNGYQIRILFFEWKAIWITYHKDTTLSDAEIEKLLKLNGDGRKWKMELDSQSERRWLTTDIDRFAFYDKLSHDLVFAPQLTECYRFGPPPD